VLALLGALHIFHVSRIRVKWRQHVPPKYRWIYSLMFQKNLNPIYMPAESLKSRIPLGYVTSHAYRSNKKIIGYFGVRNKDLWRVAVCNNCRSHSFPYRHACCMLGASSRTGKNQVRVFTWGFSCSHTASYNIGATVNTSN
jgi:hypothetical protein